MLQEKLIQANQFLKETFSLAKTSSVYNMGGNTSKESETVKAESFNQEMMRDDSFTIVNLHMPSSAGGAMLVLVVIGLGCLGYAAAKYKDYRRRVGRRAATTLEILKPCPA